MLLERKVNSHDGKVSVTNVISQYSRFGTMVNSPRRRPAIMPRVDRGWVTDSARIVAAVANVVVASVGGITEVGDDEVTTSDTA